jgi:putative hemolysin
MIVWNFLIILILVGLNAFFVSVEFSAVTSRRTRIELMAEEGSIPAQIVKSWLENPAARDRLIAASQLGITIVSLALGAVGENTFEALFAPFFHSLTLPVNLEILSPVLTSLPLVFSLIIVTSLHVVLGEQVPKVATLHNPESFALLAARPMNLFAKIFKWFVGSLDWATRQILKLVGLKMVGEHAVMYTVEEIKQILNESEEEGVIQPPEKEMLDAIFDLGGLLVRQVMIPRTEIIAVEANTLLPDILQMVTQTTYTKLPVFEDDLDQIIGILHIKDLLPIYNSADKQGSRARDLAREAIYVPDTNTVHELLHQFRDNRQHIAIALDEYGGTAGLVTLEDLIEEIVGEVSDAFDPESPDIQRLADGSVIIDGLTLIEDVNEQLGLDLHNPNYDTIAGYVLGRLGRIPRVGDVVEKDGIVLRVLAMDHLRIASVSLTHHPVQPAA